MHRRSDARTPFRPDAVTHALSIDVEDWYHDAAGPVAAPVEGRVEANTLHLLDILATQRVRATFFFLGEVAERFPGLARRVSDAGHEIGSHGYQHQRVMQMTRGEFRTDVARSLRAIEDATGRAVWGYRAPYFSITSARFSLVLKTERIVISVAPPFSTKVTVESHTPPGLNSKE